MAWPDLRLALTEGVSNVFYSKLRICQAAVYQLVAFEW